VGPEGPTDLCEWFVFGLFPVVVGIDCDFREAGFDGWSRCSFEPFPKDLVVELGRNAVFSREIKIAGFLRPVLRVMSGFQVGTSSELDLGWIQPECGQLQKRGCDGVEGPRSGRLDVEEICHRSRVIL